MTGKQVTENKGWWMYRSCTCGGRFTQKFKHQNKPSVEIWIYPNQGTFEHRLNKGTLGQGNITELQTKLETI